MIFSTSLWGMFKSANNATTFKLYSMHSGQDASPPPLHSSSKPHKLGSRIVDATLGGSACPFVVSMTLALERQCHRLISLCQNLTRENAPDAWAYSITTILKLFCVFRNSVRTSCPLSFLLLTIIKSLLVHRGAYSASLHLYIISTVNDTHAPSASLTHNKCWGLA